MGKIRFSKESMTLIYYVTSWYALAEDRVDRTRHRPQIVGPRAQPAPACPDTSSKVFIQPI